MKKHGHPLFMRKYTKYEALQVKSTHMQKVNLIHDLCVHLIPPQLSK